MQTITKSLLLEHHAGRTSPLQIRLIEAWLKEPGNEVVYYQTLCEWETAHPQYHADVTAGLLRYQAYIAEASAITPLQPAAEAPLAAPRLGFRRLSPWVMAASVTVLLGLGGWLLREPIQYKTYTTSYGQVKHVELPDGSHVVLNANSTLRAPRWSGRVAEVLNAIYGQAKQTEREVLLTGEAEFGVVHTQDNRRFVVRTGRRVDVEVLGTEFSVFNRERATRVTLLRGKVKLHCQQPNAPEQLLTMKPGESATVDGTGNLLVKTMAKPNSVVAWADHRFVFDDTPLREIGYMITENYGLNVAIKSPKLADRAVSGTFDAATADELFGVLEQLLKINVVRQRNRVVFSEKN